MIIFPEQVSMVIPSRIHQIWVGGPRPAWVDHYWALLDAEVEAQGNGLTVSRWGNAEFERSATARIMALYPGTKTVVAADLFRLELLLTRGGIYFDSDLVVLRSLEHWVGSRAPWIGQGRETTPGVQHHNNAAMGFPAGHPFLHALWVYATRALARGVTAPFSIAGPLAVRAVYRKTPFDVTLPHGPFESTLAKDIEWEGKLGRPATAEEWRKRFPDAVTMHISSTSWRDTTTQSSAHQKRAWLHA